MSAARLYKGDLGIFYASQYVIMPPTFKDLYDFVQRNKGDTFVGYSDAGIVDLLYKHIKDHSLFYEQGHDGEITGMIIADIIHEDKIIYVQENLSMNIRRLGRFALKARETWPGYKIEYTKHGIYKAPNTEKLLKKLI
jgi:hypothetical protein